MDNRWWQATRRGTGLFVGAVVSVVSFGILLMSLADIVLGMSRSVRNWEYLIAFGMILLPVALSGLVVGWRLVHRAKASTRHKDGKLC